jgi:transcription elongation factor GreA
MGWSSCRYAVETASPNARADSNVSTMPEARHFASNPDHPAGASTVRDVRVALTPADFDTLVRELESLQRQLRSDFAGRLREARAFGGSTENDDVLAALEDAAVDDARLAHLEELVQFASIVERAAGDGGAGLGSTVRVADDAGRTSEYELIGRRGQHSARNEITMASPVGQALRGARPGDVVRVALPNRRTRALRVLAVRHSSSATTSTSLGEVSRAA